LFVLLGVLAAAGCTGDPPAHPSTPTVPSPATTVRSSGPALAALPTCSDLATAAGRTLRGLRKVSEVLSTEDPAVTIRISCLYDANLAISEGPAVTVEVEVGRYAAEPGGRSGDEVAAIPMRERVRATCTSSPTVIEGSFAAAEECSNTGGLARTGVGLVKDGNYATAEIVAKNPDQSAAGVRAAVRADARRLAEAMLDQLA
jgi:hypothetical protein